jgi:hypothetical protein
MVTLSEFPSQRTCLKQRTYFKVNGFRLSTVKTSAIQLQPGTDPLYHVHLEDKPDAPKAAIHHGMRIGQAKHDHAEYRKKYAEHLVDAHRKMALASRKKIYV